MPRPAGSPTWSEPGLLVLASLAAEPRHGYAMTRDIEESFGITLGPGTLYGAIARLEEHGLIEPLPGDARRRPYRLTARGLTVLDELAEGMRRFSAATATRLAGRGRPTRTAASLA